MNIKNVPDHYNSLTVTCRLKSVDYRNFVNGCSPHSCEVYANVFGTEKLPQVLKSSNGIKGIKHLNSHGRGDQIVRKTVHAIHNPRSQSPDWERKKVCSPKNH